MEPSATAVPSEAALPPAKKRFYVMARVVLATFLFTFIASRIMVLLIMSHSIPDLYMHLGGTHVHHLNYGIILLSVCGAFLIFRQPAGR